jgi:hypothetical protein
VHQIAQRQETHGERPYADDRNSAVISLLAVQL